jgi:hypothetical protein
MRKIILLCICLTACAKTVYVPTQCPAPKLPPEPHYPVADLRPGDSPDKVAKAYVASLYACRADNKNLREICQ